MDACLTQLLSNYPNLVSYNTEGLAIVAFFSVSFLLFGSNALMMSYAEPQGEVAPQLQQQQQQQQGLTSNVTAPPSPQLQQQDPPITFQQQEEPCDGAYFVGPGGVTNCM